MVLAILLSTFALGLFRRTDAAAVSVQIDSFQDLSAGAALRPTIEIGTALTLTCCSKYHNMGLVLRRSYEMYFDWVNSARGGINVGGVKHNVKLTLIDDDSSPDRVTEITEYLVKKKGLKLLLGPYSSTLTERAARVANATGAVLVAPASSASKVFIGRDRVFGTLTPSNEFLQSSFTSLSGRTMSVGYIAEATTFTNATCSTVETLAMASNMKFKGGVTISDDADDAEVIQAMEKLMEDPPELLVGCTYYNACKRVLRSAQKLGFNPKAMLFTICVTMPEFMEEMGEAARYVLGATQWSPTMAAGSANWTAQSFELAYYNRYGTSPPYQGASAWASAEALTNAIESAGSTDPFRVMGALRILDLPTLFGRVAFDTVGQSVNIFNAVQFPQEGYTSRMVVPESRAEMPMIFPMKTWEERPCLQRNFEVSGSVGYNSTGHCAPCDPNSESQFNNVTLTRSCKPCPEGTILTDQGTCIVCGKGELVAPDGRGCMRCEPGKFKSPDGRNPETGLLYRRGDRCTACDPGYYQDQEAQEECKPCWPGTFSEQPGSAMCTRCSPLSRHPFIDAKVLANRDFRFFCRREASTSAMVSECDVCTLGSQGAIKDAAICCDYAIARIHTTLTKELGKEVRYCSHGDPASASPIFCSTAEQPPACPEIPQHSPKQETFYQPFGEATSCRRCPVGTLCEATCPEQNPNCTAQEVVRVSFDAGVDHYVMRHPEALAIKPEGLGPFRCITPGACVGRNKCLNTDESKHTGILCGSCAPGYTTKSVNQLCSKCPSLAVNLIYVWVGCAILAVYIMYFIRASFKAVHNPRAVEAIVLKVFINYCQMTAVSFAVAKIGVEDYLSWYIDGAVFMSQDPVGIVMSFDCLFDLRGRGEVVDYFNLWMALFIVPIVSTVTCILYGFAFAIKNFRRKKHGKEKKKFHPKIFIPVMLIPIFIAHPIATQYFLSVFDCGKNNPGTSIQYDTERLLSNLDVDCSSDEHLNMQNASIIGIVVISFGVPAFFCAMLRILKHKLHQDNVFELIGFLYNGFEPNVYYFESVIMLRKVLFTICAVIPGLDDDGRTTVMLFVAIIFLAVNNTMEPWDDRNYNLLDRIEAASLRAIILLLLARLVQAVTDTSYRFREQSTKDSRDVVLQLLVLSQHIWVLALLIWGLQRDRIRPLLVRLKLAGSTKNVELGTDATLDASDVPPADRNFLVMIYGDAVDFLLDTVQTVDLRDLGMVIRGAVSIAIADRQDNAAKEGFMATVDKKALTRQGSSRDSFMNHSQIDGLVDRDSTTFPKEIMLGPLTVEELHMGFMYLINHMENLEMSCLERFGVGDVFDKPDGPPVPTVNTLLQATRCIVQVKGLKRVFSVQNDLALFNMQQESPEEKMSKRWKQTMQAQTAVNAFKAPGTEEETGDGLAPKELFPEALPPISDLQITEVIDPEGSPAPPDTEVQITEVVDPEGSPPPPDTDVVVDEVNMETPNGV